MDLIENHKRFGAASPTTHKMATCRSCRKTIKQEYYYSHDTDKGGKKNVADNDARL